MDSTVTRRNMFKNLKKYKRLKKEYKDLRTSEESTWKAQKSAESSFEDEIQRIRRNLPRYLPGDEKYYIYPSEYNGWQVSKGFISFVTYNNDYITRYEIADLNEDLFSWPTLENLIFDNECDAKDAAKFLTSRGISDVFEANSRLDSPISSSWITIKDIASEWWLQHVC